MIREITTGPNYKFIVNNFRDAKKDLKEEENTGIIIPDRIQGIGLEGASRTGKSWDISIFICQYVQKYSGKTVVIARDWRSTLRITAYITLKKVWGLFDMPMTHFNKTMTDIEYNGNMILFVGINDDIEKAKGLESNFLWVNEGLSAVEDAVSQMTQRCTELYTIDYNPDDLEHYLYDKEVHPSYNLHKTCIFDNKYAPRNSVKQILGYAHPEVDDYDFLKDKPIFKQRFKSLEEWQQFKRDNVELMTANEHKWKVQGLGIRSAGEDQIFDHIYSYDEDPIDYTWKLYGGDFGFKNDPTTLVQVIKSGHNLYIKELIYDTGILNDTLGEIILENGWVDVNSSWDKAGEASVAELINKGIPAYAPSKPPGSKEWGLQKLQQLKIHVHKDSKNAREEFKKQKWAKDRQGNYKRNTMGQRVPVDKDDHTVDATRYALAFGYTD